MASSINTTDWLAASMGKEAVRKGEHRYFKFLHGSAGSC